MRLSPIDLFRPPAWLAVAGFLPSTIYAAAMRLRAGLYRRGWLRVQHLGRPVLAVGNLTVGGSGKTPVVLALARELAARGWQPAILSRGYGGIRPPGSRRNAVRLVSDGVKILLGPDWAGDEPYLLARKLPGVPVLCHPRRYRAGQFALHNLGADVFLLDDAFQHLVLHRDFNLLLVDGKKQFGNGRVLPAGPLREPLAAARRADAILLTRVPEGADLAPLRQRLAELAGPVPVFSAGFAPGALVDSGGLAGGELKDWLGRPAIAFCGLADPNQFFRMLAAAGVDPLERLAFADHQRYGPEEIGRIAAAFRRTGAEVALTTEKDIVKLEHQSAGGPVRAVELIPRLHQPELADRIVSALTRAASGK